MINIPKMIHGNLEKKQEFVNKVTSDIEGQNWTNKPLTEAEQNLIFLAVCSTLNLISDM